MKAIPKALRSLKPSGVVFGKHFGNYASKKESLDGHILVIGGSGSGKSSCIAIPTLLSWNGPVFAIDIKGELYDHSQSFRTDAICINPLESSIGYDPFCTLDSGKNPVQDAREIALALIPEPVGNSDPFWARTAQNLLAACIVHFHPEGKTFIETIDTILSSNPKALLKELSESKSGSAVLIGHFTILPPATISGVFTELSSRLIEFSSDKNVRDFLSMSNSISPACLEEGHDIFVRVPEHLIEQWGGLLRLITIQTIRHLERRADTGNKKTLVLVDEAARLGKIEILLGGLATLRSKGATFMIIIQSLAQLDMVYGSQARKAIADNCPYKAVLGASDPDTQESLSRLIGTAEKPHKTRGSNYKAYTKNPAGTSTSFTTVEKRIIKPEQLGTLRDIILLNPYNGHCMLKKAPYFSDKAFAGASKSST
ncbi:MAG: type IV secretory system conjugative DNA transfer family protein [Eubacteriaceae bacterium]|nr:type IV secretory system conjugative DNA transfer family protein [Eubacteriaceae bacterium]